MHKYPLLSSVVPPKSFFPHEDLDPIYLVQNVPIYPNMDITEQYPHNGSPFSDLISKFVDGIGTRCLWAVYMDHKDVTFDLGPETKLPRAEYTRYWAVALILAQKRLGGQSNYVEM